MAPPQTQETAVQQMRWTTPGALSEPLVRSVPYVELTLEHPSLEPTSVGRSFFPDAVPYRSDDEHRIFYWRAVLPDDAPAPDRWTGVCATTSDLVAITHEQTYTPGIESLPEGGTELVVDGTVAGDSTTAHVTGYEPPDVELRHVTPDGVELVLPTGTTIVAPGTRETARLPAQTVQVVESEDPEETTPELVVRYPGERTLYHPPVTDRYRLFPSFGLDLADLSNPTAVPTTGGELDHRALAADLDVVLSDQPYPVRVLWQAFAHTAFDPHHDGQPKLTQFPSGLIAVTDS
jgi:hypothetical protein